MKNLLKNAFLHKYLNFRLKLLQKQDRSYNFASELKNTQKILVILPSEQEYTEHMQDFIKRLGSEFKNAKVSTFVSSTLRKTDLSWLGLPNEQYLNLIREENFDLVVDVNTEQDQVCSYLCALSGAPMRLNLTSGTYDFIYNLHIRSDSEKSLDHKLANVISYLTHLTKN